MCYVINFEFIWSLNTFFFVYVESLLCKCNAFFYSRSYSIPERESSTLGFFGYWMDLQLVHDLAGAKLYLTFSIQFHDNFYESYEFAFFPLSILILLMMIKLVRI